MKSSLQKILQQEELLPKGGFGIDEGFAMSIREMIPLTIRRRLGGIGYQLRAWWDTQCRLWRHRGSGVGCNVCGWEGGSFTDDAWHPGTVCPRCGSQVRHRLLVQCLDTHPMYRESELLRGKSILHFAPERQLRKRIQQAATRYTTTDFDRGDVDLKLDMSAMPEVSDATYDVVIACDVLEHVPDDLAAMRELRRILRPGGLAVLSVPQKDPPAPTDEDASVHDPAERERRFGQKDHVRIFGDDFVERLEKAGFRVEVVTVDNFPLEAQKRFVLHPPVLSSHPLATNYRRIYFAQA